VLYCGDALLGWTLSLPRDLTLVVLGLVCAGALAAMRRATTDSDQLRQITADERRLRELRRAAYSASAPEALERNRAVRRLVAGERARQEWRYVAAALLFLAAVMTWGNVRLSFMPVRIGESVQFIARFPATAADAMAYLAPQPGLVCLNGWIQPVAREASVGGSAGSATWILQFDGAADLALLTVRFGEHNIEHPVRIDGLTYLAPVRRGSAGIETEVRLAPYRPLAFLPPRLLGLPTWALVLTLICGAGYLSLRRCLAFA
jgi:hypothetical protein